MGFTLTELTQKRFLLVNESGDALESYYIEIPTLPSAGQMGHAVYTGLRDDEVTRFAHDISFEFHDGKLTCWDGLGKNGVPYFFHIMSREDGEVVGLFAQYQNGYGATFVVEEDVIEDEDYPSELFELTACKLSVAQF